MTTPKERMSEARLAQLREMYFNNQGVKNLFAECIAEIDALRAELTAARTVAEGEVANYTIRVHTIANHALDPGPARTDLHHAADLLTRLSAAKAEAERERDEARALADARKIDADNAARWAVKEACKPWEHCVGDLPEWESPLMNVWQAALTWSEEAIAKHLGVKTYESGDGSESVEGDYLGSIMSILTHAGLYDSETGDPSHVTAEAKLAKARAALAQARADVLEEAAKWHDQRRRDTPDAFEMEFHEVSAKSIRALKPTPTQESETP